uniref:C2H2-type domain-containing protein n=1 Tax=Sphenodon punctatus TaxID=8508 RepID=A0A8D0GQP4_SPHPU
MIKSEAQNLVEGPDVPVLLPPPLNGMPSGVPLPEENFQTPKPEAACESGSFPVGVQASRMLEEAAPSRKDLHEFKPVPQEMRAETGPYVCTECWESFSTEQQFLQHHRIHAGGEAYRDDVSPAFEPRAQQGGSPDHDESSPWKQPLPPGVGKPYACSLCPKSFRLKTSLMIHQKTHTVGKGESLFVCPECGSGFSHQGQLNRHRTVHADRPHQCPECHKAFNRKSSLVVHQKTHRERPRPFQCPQCSKNFIRKQHLDEHTRTHTGEKPYQCPECEKRFAEKSKLTNHYRIHTGERPYRCGQCDKRFVRAHHLVKHQSSVHQAGARLYPCRECGQSFPHAQAFLGHQASHAEGERRHRCTECLKSFARRKYLLEHQRMHTGENPYSCSLCNKHFRYKQSLKQHLRAHGVQHGPTEQASFPDTATQAKPADPAAAAASAPAINSPLSSC